MKKIVRALALVLTLALTCVAFVACAPKDVEAAEAKMKDAGYACVAVSDSDKEEGAVGGIVATKLNNIIDADVVVAVLYDSSASAQEAYDKAVDEDKEDDENVVKKSGKWVLVGTEAAVEAFLG